MAVAQVVETYEVVAKQIAGHHEEEVVIDTLYITGEVKFKPNPGYRVRTTQSGSDRHGKAYKRYTYLAGLGDSETPVTTYLLYAAGAYLALSALGVIGTRSR